MVVRGSRLRAGTGSCGEEMVRRGSKLRAGERKLRGSELRAGMGNCRGENGVAREERCGEFQGV